MLSQLLRRNWKVVAGLMVADFVWSQVQKRMKATRASRLDGEKQEGVLKASLQEMVEQPGHRGQLNT